MSKNYDNWERLVDAVWRREQFRELARASDLSSCSSSFSSNYSPVQDSFLARGSSFDEYKVIASRSERGGFYLDERSGKKCCMLCARELIIAWGDRDIYWKWAEYPGSRFSEVAHLLCVWWLDIRGKIKTRMLSSNTTYGVYLVFKLDEQCYGLESAKAVVRFVDNEMDVKAERRARVVHLQQPGQLPSRRSDGWMEVEMGSFYNDSANDREAEGRLMEIWKLGYKSGLIVEGVEFRPMI